MTARIVIETDCPERDRSGRCKGGGSHSADGWHRRYLRSDSFECVDNADERWIYLVTEEVHQALAGGDS